jgi:hypothetical protein
MIEKVGGVHARRRIPVGISLRREFRAEEKRTGAKTGCEKRMSCTDGKRRTYLSFCWFRYGLKPVPWSFYISGAANWSAEDILPYLDQRIA